MKYSNPDPDTQTAGRRHRVAVLVYDGVKLLDVAGPAEVFSEANRLGTDYVVQLVSPTGADVVTSVGIRLTVELAPGDVTAADTLLVSGGDIYPRTPVPGDLADAATALAARSGRVASICTGAFILAAAGELHGKRATTHWKVVDTLASRYPDIRVEPDAIYTRDGSTYTSAGVTAGIDLALALVEEDHGPEPTRDVARALVVYLQRSGGQSQFSAPLAASPPRTPALRHIVDIVTADPAGSHSLTELAARLHVSPRHLSRLFRDELATTPARYVESIRFDRQGVPQRWPHGDGDRISGGLSQLRKYATRLRPRGPRVAGRVPTRVPDGAASRRRHRGPRAVDCPAAVRRPGGQAR